MPRGVLPQGGQEGPNDSVRVDGALRSGLWCRPGALAGGLREARGGAGLPECRQLQVVLPGSRNRGLMVGGQLGMVPYVPSFAGRRGRVGHVWYLFSI